MTALTWQSFRSRPAKAPPLIMAHRGASDDLPENTLPAFRLALAQGAHVLEADLRFTHDDAIVLMHDASVERTTDGRGAVSEMALAEIKKLHARRVQAIENGDLSVPTPAELLQATNVPLALELKNSRFANENDARRLVDLLAQHGALERCVVISFHLPLLKRIKALAPQMPIGVISVSNPLPLYPTEFIGPFFPLL
jgi:glycerophosphoryl diester phosphodiesterase